MTPALYNQILERLLAEDGLEPRVLDVVDAACRGPAALDEQLGSSGAPGSTTMRVDKRSPGRPAGVYLKELEVGGFRGIGPPRKLELTPGPGMTLVIGRNGSGKSSFSEGLEALLTGESRRWSARHKDWKRGWRNLHTTENPFVQATFLLEGSEPIVVRRSWKHEDDVDRSELRVRRGANALAGALHDLDWVEPLVTFRPFLSHSELGAVLEQPSKLYDPLKRILGLEEVVEAIKLLEGARKERDARRKSAKKALDGLRTELHALDDPRAASCLAAVSGKKPDLAVIARVVLAQDDSDNVTTIGELRRIAQLQGPDLERVGEAVSRVRDARAARAEVADTGEAQSAALAELLQQALAYVETGAGPCPVCEAELPPDWPNEAQKRLSSSCARAENLGRAASYLKQAVGSLRSLVTQVPPVLRKCGELGLPTDVWVAWEKWCAVPDDDAALGEHMEASVLDLVPAMHTLRKEAAQRIEVLQSAWSPVALRLAAWLDEARRVASEAESLATLKKAEKWLKAAESALRDALFAPIASDAQRVWSLLRQDSHVDLAGVRLDGTGTRRRVVLDVTVDGTDGAALAVMSQGELNALALSLFLPRMTMGQSPFHFVVIDDPVQAMDPHKVDGLATALAHVAKTRQVVVFTHDNRLYEAIRRLGIEATVLEVQRRAQSVVEIHKLLDPVARHLHDAMQCVHNQHALGPRMAARTVPTFCRLALEAACVEAFRRRRLSRGDAHLPVEEAIESAQGAQAVLALVINDDAAQTDTVYRNLNKAHGAWATDLFKAIKQGAHHAYDGDLQQLVATTRKLAQLLRRAA